MGKLNLKYEGEKELNIADRIASAMQRLDLPQNLRDFSIYFKTSTPVFKHPLSGTKHTLSEEIKDFITTYGYENMLKKYGFNSEDVKVFLDEKDWKKTYFLLWRFLPEKYHQGYFLPADTRIPDHSIWDHLDVTAAISSCIRDLGLLAVKLPAVQEFISHSRKLSDLWASSHIFSLIIFEGIKVIIENYGPDAIIYPQLRGNPMVDLTEFNGLNMLNEGLRLNLIKNSSKVKNRLSIANFPNTFLSIIPASNGKEVCRKVEEVIKQKWMEIANKGKETLNENKINIDEKLWRGQIENAIEVTSVWMAFLNLDAFNNVKDHIPKDLKDRQEKWLSFIQEPNYGHFYYITYELLGSMLKQKSRLWSGWMEDSVTGKKCLMCGRRSALIENNLEKGYLVWNESKWAPIIINRAFKNLLKDGERLCAVCLIKRLYGWREKSIFKRLFKVDPPEWDSVVCIAAKDFIEKVKTDEEVKIILKTNIELVYEQEWREEQLFSKEIKEKFEELWKTYGEPNKYYAILMMDGDRIGRVLSGEYLPDFEEFLHPEFKNEMVKRGGSLLKTKRILTPSHHIAISRVMKDFSLYKVPEVVKNYDGFLVYAGGDDILALFPSSKVLEAAYEIQEYFKKDFYEVEVNEEKREVMGLGNKATISAGIVFAHYKWPLYDAIEKTRDAEKDAKNRYGRNAFCITFIKRSGETLTAGGDWSFVPGLILIAKAIINEKISHKFIYDFMNVSEVLDGEKLNAEIKRLLKRRMKNATEGEIKEIQENLSRLIEKYSARELSIKEVGRALKILYEAYKSEEK
ncbi:MAG: type III-B CRISPR-associated protein Cas10/Cmr2 [Candidatus Bathyarchaeia archaeon]